MTSIDPARLRVAAHELGHALVWSDAGLPIREIRVTGNGDKAQGWVNTTIPASPSRDQARLFLVGMVAGRAAGIRWCEQHGLAHDEHSCQDDEKAFRQHQRGLRMTELTRRHARAEAARLVRVRWRLIVRLAPRLARAGTISM